MNRIKTKNVIALLLSLLMLIAVLPISIVADSEGSSEVLADGSNTHICEESFDNARHALAEYAETQLGKTGSQYAASDGIDFDWCVWFTTYCASNIGLCGTPNDYTCNVFPPIERGTWSANNWAATGVTYQINWFTENGKGLFRHFGSLDSRIRSNDNVIRINRDDYVPERGDLIYFDWEVDSYYNHVAIVCDYDSETDTVTYIGGNQGTDNQNWPERCVSTISIQRVSAEIVGYLKIYNQPLSTRGKTASEIIQQIRDTYTQAKALNGGNSFNGYCGAYVSRQLQVLGINTGYVAGNGNQQYNKYCNLSQTTGGYGVVAYPASQYSLSSALNSMSSQGNVYNILVGFEKGWSGYDGQTYGHVLFVHAIIDGTVYYSESFDGTYGSEGSPISCTISQFASRYGQRVVSGETVYELDGLIHFTSETPKHFLDLNGKLDNESFESLVNYGTADVYVNNGSRISNDTTDFYEQWENGTTYELKDIKPNPGYSYDGVASGSRTGTITKDTTIVLAFSRNDFTKITEEPEAHYFNGHTYYYYSTPVTWYFAKEFCEAQGGHLATIANSAENEFVKSLFDNKYVWLGATDYGTTNEWRWVTGETFAFADWCDSEPSNGSKTDNDTEDYLHYYEDEKWNDNDGCRLYSFVLEVDGVDHEHYLEHIIASEATCTVNGNAEYWHCTGCGKYYSDAEGNNVITQESTVIPALGHEFADSFVPATCINYAGTMHSCTRCDYSYTDYYPEYSEWSTSYPEGIDESLLESKTEYRYRDYETNTSYDSSMGGWDRIGSEWVQSGTGAVNYVSVWPSGFNTNHGLYGTYHNAPVAASETDTDKTVINANGTIGYIYWHWCRGTYTNGPINRQLRPYWTEEYNTFHAFYSSTTPTNGNLDDYTDPAIGALYYYQFSNGDCCTDTYWYYAFPVLRQTYTNYRKLFTYGHWTEWSDWSDEEVTASDTREVETRTVYRYITSGYGPHAWDDGAVTIAPTFEAEGEMTYTCTLCGETRTETIPVLEHFTVTFVDWDGTLLKTECVAPGAAASAPADPTRVGYTFTGWDREFGSITANTVVTAQYAINSYTVTYYIDGEQYGTQTVEYGAQIEPPQVDVEGYTFSGWMLSDGSALPEVMPAHDLDVFGMLARNYVTVTYTGAYIGTAQVPFGGNAVLPVLDAVGVHYTFTVNGEPWDGVALTGDVTVEVGMDINVYTVAFVDPVDGQTLSVQSVTHGQNASAPAAPQHYGYTFGGWDTEFTNVQSDLTVMAIFDPVEYTVVFMDGCDNVIETQSVPYLSAATAPADPVREGWTFTGWDVDFSCVEHALIVNATWSRNYYTVTFVGVYSGTVTVEHGADCELPVYNSSSVHYTFSVNGEPWDGKCIVGDVTVTVGVAVNGTYTVTFLDWDGSVIDTQQVAYGAAAAAPADPSREGYTFIGWDGDFSCVTADVVVTALYEENSAPTVVTGDVNGDGMVTATDISVLFAYVMNAGSLSADAMLAADVNGDGAVNATDASLLAQMVFGA